MGCSTFRIQQRRCDTRQSRDLLEPSVDLGSFFYWEAWVAPRTNGYLISDGYGGAHALLWGPILLSSSSMIFQGNIWNGRHPSILRR